MPELELTASLSALGLAVLSTLAVMSFVVVATRVAGLRSFSKMSSFDFANTLAIGSTIAAVSMSRSSLAVGVTVLATLYAWQAAVALARRNGAFSRVVDNEPVLLAGPGAELLPDALDRTRVTVDDVRAQLRQANVTDLSRVRAIVFETTGAISVLHGDGPLDPALLERVRGAERLALEGTTD
ncbi:MAG: DUF421 domain-containing protein [Actinomycetes bacterium]